MVGRRARDPHARPRELIAARIDHPLTRLEQRELATHLATCLSCRTADRDYRAQRAALRSLPQLPAPRDLWARTATALDRETARRGYPPGLPNLPTMVGRSAVVTATVVAGLALVLSVSTFPPSLVQASDAPATPFGVSSQALAFVATSDTGFAYYLTRVSQVCPAAAPDCTSPQSTAEIVPAVFTLPHQARPQNIVMSPNSAALAIIGREPDSHDSVSVLQVPDDWPPTPRPSLSLGPATPSPIATASHQPGPTDTLDLIAPHRPTPLPTATPLPSAGADATLVAVAILEDVLIVGAPPSWSDDGNRLAFSAMPADRTTGPDVYTWQPGDEHAMALTTDHASYFASWSNKLIVADRVAVSQSKAGGVAAELVALDPKTGQEQLLDEPPLWLPAISPTGTAAAGWYGRLAWSHNRVVPIAGQLVLADWTPVTMTDEPAKDPPSPDTSTEPNPTADPNASPAASADPDASPDANPSSDPNASPAPTDTADASPSPADTAAPSPSDSATPDATASPDATAGADLSPSPDSGASPSPSAAASGLPDGMSPIEVGRDPERRPVLDWIVRWSGDGALVGYWIADTPAAGWGELTVVGYDAEAHSLTADAPLLATLARRGFTLGSSRIAYVAAADGSPYGVLSILTWGSEGIGGLRFNRPNMYDVTLPY